jgi:hypothetical protein
MLEAPVSEVCSRSPVAITGSSEAVDSRLADQLSARGIPLVLVAFDVQRPPRVVGAEVRQASGYTMRGR